jgi:hypothetical protein
MGQYLSSTGVDGDVLDLLAARPSVVDCRELDSALAGSGYHLVYPEAPASHLGIDPEMDDAALDWLLAHDGELDVQSLHPERLPIEVVMNLLDEVLPEDPKDPAIVLTCWNRPLPAKANAAIAAETKAGPAPVPAPAPEPALVARLETAPVPGPTHSARPVHKPGPRPGPPPVETALRRPAIRPDWVISRGLNTAMIAVNGRTIHVDRLGGSIYADKFGQRYDTAGIQAKS